MVILQDRERSMCVTGVHASQPEVDTVFGALLLDDGVGTGIVKPFLRSPSRLQRCRDGEVEDPMFCASRRIRAIQLM
jgi:hypothetical protein